MISAEHYTGIQQAVTKHVGKAKDEKQYSPCQKLFES
jgi:hypothetical protein